MPNERQETFPIIPSPDLAWIIGSLSGKGTVNLKTGLVSPHHENEEVQKEFIRLGEQIFGIDILPRPQWTYRGGESLAYLTPSFYSTRFARFLGDLSRDQFPKTIETKHVWILQDSEFTHRYVEGLFEARGNIYKRATGASKDIIFQTSFPNVSDFIADVLTKLGVTPTIIKMRRGSQLRTKGVTISTLPEQKKFSELVHSLDLEKEVQLEKFRDVSLEGTPIRVKSKDDLIGEWRKMTDLLGHPPNQNEIDALRAKGSTRWAHETYMHWFGTSEKGKRFSIARKQLTAITNPELVRERLKALAEKNQRRTKRTQDRVRRLHLFGERERRLNELDRALHPSRELAWVLGILAVGGSVNLHSGSTVLDSQNEHLQNAYIDVAGKIFRTNLTWATGSQKFKRKMPQFNNTIVARRLGDLRRTIWPTTILEKHRWIIEDHGYTWAFLSGIFDDKGIFTGTHRHQFIIPTSYRNVANFIAELMANVGIQSPSIISSSRLREGVQGVTVANIRDLKKFADNVHSVNPEKEQILESIRIDTTRKSRNQSPFNKNELIAEWKRLYKLLGHPPNVTDLNDLYAEGKTKWSRGVYVRVFGRTNTNKGDSYSYKIALYTLAAACGLATTDEAVRYRRPDSKYTIVKDSHALIAQYRNLRERTLKDKGRLPVTRDFDLARKTRLISYSRVTFANYFGEGSLVKALTNLERIVFSADLNESLVQYENNSRKQVCYTEKIHRDILPFIGEYATSKLDEISKSAQLPPVLFYTHNGNPLILGKEISTEQTGGTIEANNLKNSVTLYGPNLNSELLKVTAPEIPEPAIIVIGQTKSKSEVREMDELIKPSRNLAWILGTLAAGGYVNLKTGCIEVSGEQPILDRFKDIGLNIFKKEIKLHSYTRKGLNKPYIRARLCSVDFARSLGDLRRNSWPDTIKNKHAWILQASNENVWPFLEGFFDTRGSISFFSGKDQTTPLHPVIYLSTTSSNGANALVEMLGSVGIDNAFIHRSKNTKEGVRGAVISNLEDVRGFAEHISSSIPDKQKALENCQNRFPHLSKHFRYTDDELESDWRMLANLLDRNPSSWDLRRNYPDYFRIHTERTYAQRFGNGNFATARRNLEKLLESDSETM